MIFDFRAQFERLYTDEALVFPAWLTVSHTPDEVMVDGWFLIKAASTLPRNEDGSTFLGDKVFRNSTIIPVHSALVVT
jgi:hypothetical protein